MQQEEDPSPIFRFLKKILTEPLPWGDGRWYMQDRFFIVGILACCVGIAVIIIVFLLFNKQENVTPLKKHGVVKSYAQSLAYISVNSNIQVLPQSQSLAGQQSVFSLVGRSIHFGKQERNTIYGRNVANVNHMARQVDQFSKTIFGDSNKQMRLGFPVVSSFGFVSHAFVFYPTPSGIKSGKYRNKNGNPSNSITQGHASSVSATRLEQKLNSRGSSPQEVVQ